MEKKKRIITRIGDIFCIEIDNEYKCYFQYIAKDMSQLNSSVIRVFKRHYPMDYEYDEQEVLNDEVNFYAHTILRIGIDNGTWYKVGKSKELGDLTKILFKFSSDLGGGGGVKRKSYHWYVWKLNEEYIHIGELTDDFKNKSDFGLVIQYCDVFNKIKNGFYKLETILS